MGDESKATFIVNTKVEGVEDLGKTSTAMSKIVEQIVNLDDSLDKAKKKLEALASESKKLFKSTNIDLLYGDQSKIQIGRSSVRYNPNDPASMKSTEAQREKMKVLLDREIEVQEQYCSLLEERARKLSQDNDNYKKLLNQEQYRLRNAKKRNEVNEVRARAYAQKVADESGWKRYRSENPERFGKNAYNIRYQTGYALDNVGRMISSKGGFAGRVAGDITSLIGSAITSPAVAFGAAIKIAGKAITDFTSAAVDSYKQMEAIKTQLGVVYGSQSQADTAFSQLSQYATKSPFGIEQTTELAVLLRQSGVYSSELLETLKMIGDTAGGNMEKMKRIANNYAQIVSIGKASMLDMRQFAYAGIPIFEKVSEELGVSQKRLRKLISDGEVTAEVIKKVFQDMTGEGGIFEKATEKGARTLKARTQNLKDMQQLMLSEFGYAFSTMGRSGSKPEGWVYDLTSFQEELFSKLYRWEAINNIERDVKNIYERRDEAEKLIALIEYNRSKGNVKEVKMLQAQLAKLIDLDAERNTLNKAFEERTERQQRYEEQGRGTKSVDNKAIADVFSFVPSMVLLGLSKFLPTKKLQDFAEKALGGNFFDLLTRVQEAEDFERFKQEGGGPNADMKLANAEVVTQTAQNEFADMTSSFNDSTSSINKTQQEILAFWETTEEYKKEQEEKKLSKWAEVQEKLKQIDKHLDENNNILLNGSVSEERYGLSGYEFLKLRREGALEGRKLAVVNDKPELLAQDRPIYRENMKWASVEIGQLIGKLGTVETANAKKLSDMFANLLSTDAIEDNKVFINAFDSAFSEMEKELKGMASGDSVPKSTKKTYEDIIDLLRAILSEWKSDTSGKDINIDPEEKARKEEAKHFTPLWKRLLSQSTGLSANVITSTRDTLDTYRDNLSARNMAGNMFATILKEGGSVSTIQSLLKQTGTGRVNKGDTGLTYQVDWKATKEAIKEFANSLSASTEVIGTYKSSLQSQIDVYTQLLSTGITSGETQDNVNKLTASKTWEELVKDKGDMLINAFGETLTDQYGNTITSIVDGKYYNNQGVEVQKEQLRVTGDIFTMVNKNLEELRTEMLNVNVAEMNASVRDSLISQMYETRFVRDAINTGAFTPASINFLRNDSSGFEKRIENEYQKVRGNNEVNDAVLLSILNKDDVLKELNENDVDKILEVLSVFASFKDLQKLQYSDNMQEEVAAGLNKKGLKLSSSSAGTGDEVVKITNIYIEEIFRRLAESVNKFTEEGLYKDLYGSTDSYGYSKGGVANKESEELYTNIMANIYARAGAQNGDMTYYAKKDKAYKKPSSPFMKRAFDEAFEAAGWGKDFDIKEAVAYMNEHRAEDQEEITEDTLRLEAASKLAADAMSDLSEKTAEFFEIAAQDTWLAPWETFGECLVTGADALETVGESLKKIGAELLSNMGKEMASAGFSLAKAGAIEIASKNPAGWGMVAAGLGLAAAGGFASGIGGALTSSSNDSKDKDQTEKLNKLADRLQDLLEQARTDALYYERNMRHRTALGMNSMLTDNTLKVNDAIITKSGQVVQTSPDDYIFATKNPQSMGANYSVSPQINVSVTNNTGAQVTQRETVDANGNSFIEFYIDNKIEEFIATERGDEAFNARNVRLNGRTVVR